MKTILSYIILTFCACSFAQPHTIDHKKDRLMQTNFNGPIKSFSAEYAKFSNDTTIKVTNDQIIQNERSIISKTDLGFDKTGKIVWSDRSKTFKKQNPKYDLSIRYEYDQDDINYKQSLQLVMPESYPVIEDIFEVKLNVKKISKNHDYQPNAIADYQKDSLKMYYVNYLYKTDNKQQIVEERYYSFFKEYHPAGDPTDLTYYTNLYTISYYYDTKGKLLKQNIFRGDGPGINSRMYGVSDWSIPFHAMGTESGFCEDLHFSYQYDAKDRITDIVFFGCNDTLAYEKYTYNDNLGYISKIRKYVGGVGGSFQITKTTDYYYDKYANVIKREYIPTIYQSNYHFQGMPRITYYKYDYDKYNNWIKCYIYYTGKPEGEPTAVVERKIEYYEE